MKLFQVQVCQDLFNFRLSIIEFCLTPFVDLSSGRHLREALGFGFWPKKISLNRSEPNFIEDVLRTE